MSVYDAADAGDSEEVVNLLTQDPSMIEEGQDDGCGGVDTPLVAAARNGDVKMAKLLLGRGADSNPDTANIPPLNLACLQGDHEMIELLLDYGADSAGGPFGNPGEHCASFREGTGITPEDFDNSPTCLMQCARSGCAKSVLLLLKHDASDLDKQADYNRTALWYAVAYDSADVVQLLLEAGADGSPAGELFMNDEDDPGGHYTALQLAAKMGHGGCLRSLRAREREFLLWRAYMAQVLAGEASRWVQERPMPGSGSKRDATAALLTGRLPRIEVATEALEHQVLEHVFGTFKQELVPRLVEMLSGGEAESLNPRGLAEAKADARRGDRIGSDDDVDNADEDGDGSSSGDDSSSGVDSLDESCSNSDPDCDCPKSHAL